MFLLVMSTAFATLNDAKVYYSFDDSELVGANPLDISGNNITATNDGATTGVAGILNQQFDYDGVNDDVTFPEPFALTGDFTVGLWITPDTVSGNQEILANSLSAASTNLFRIQILGADLYVSTKDGTYLNIDTTVNLASGVPTHFVVVRNQSLGQCLIYADGSYVTNINCRTGDLSWSNFIIGTGANNNRYNGKVDEYVMYNRTLTSQEVSELYNLNSNPYTINFLTVQAQNYWDNSSINEFNATASLINASGTFNFTGSTTNGTIEFNEISKNVLINITVFKDNYLPNDTYTNYNTSNSPLTARLSEAQISLDAQALITNATISPANFTIEGQTFSDGQLINISAGDYNVTFSKAGWYNKTQQITVIAGASQNFTISDVYDAQLNLTYLDAQTNATIDTYTLTVENSNYSQEYAVTNESNYIVNVLENIDYNIIFTKSGYFSKTFNHFANQSFQNISTVVTEIGDIEIKVFDLNTTSLLSTNVTLLVQNSTTEETYTIQNGISFIESLQQGQQYNLQFSAVGYVTNNYVFTYTNQTTISLYLNQGQTDITFITQDSASSPLNDVEVKIERFVNGTYTVISLGETDIIGTYIANLQTGLTHRITFTKDNYITQSFITQLSELSYTVTLQTQTVFDIAQGLQTVKTSFSPTNNTLYPNTVAFEINITNEDFNFEYYYARLKYNGTVLVSDNNTDAQGGTLNFNYNLSAFNNTGLPLVLEYGYFGQDAGLIISYHTYAVSSDENYSGSFLQLRDKLAVSLSILEKLSIFAFVFIVLLLMFSTMTTGLVNVIISSGIALLVGWIVGINLIILIIIFVLSTFIMLAYGSSRI